MSSEGAWENLRLMRHLARRVEEGRTPGARVSNCPLNKHRLINSLWAKVSERSEGVFLGRYPSALLNHQNFANTYRKAEFQASAARRTFQAAVSSVNGGTGGRVSPRDGVTDMAISFCWVSRVVAQL